MADTEPASRSELPSTERGQAERASPLHLVAQGGAGAGPLSRVPGGKSLEPGARTKEGNGTH